MKTKNKSKSGSFQKKRSLCTSETVDCEEPGKGEQGREDLSATKKDKTQENACQQKQRDIIKIQRIQTCRKEQFEKDKLNGEKEEKRKKGRKQNRKTRILDKSSGGKPFPPPVEVKPPGTLKPFTLLSDFRPNCVARP
jgi:hypothetical protein